MENDSTALWFVDAENGWAGGKSFLTESVTSDGGEIFRRGSSALVTPASVVSRKVHGAAGEFDLPLPLAGTPGVECRSGGPTGNHRVVFTFPAGVTLNGASVVPSPGKTANMDGTPAFSPDGRTVTLNLTNVSDAQTLSVLLSGVSDGTNRNDVGLQMRVLLGDVNGNGAVNSSDVAQVRTNAGVPVGSANFRADLTRERQHQQFRPECRESRLRQRREWRHRRGDR